MTCSRRSWPWWRWALTGLSVLALALSAYLSWHYLAVASAIGCVGGHACDEVLSSRWSTVGGVLPVSGLAAGAYLAMLVAGSSIGPATAAPVRRLAWRAMLVLGGAAAGSAVWFTIVQKWIIGAFCLYCTATHITGVLLAALILWQAPRQRDDDSTGGKKGSGTFCPEGPEGASHKRFLTPFSRPAPNATTGAVLAAPAQGVAPTAPRRLIGRLPALGLSMVGVALAGSLAACQVGFAPRSVYRGGQSQHDVSALDPHAVPLAGSPDARHVVAVLFDYECPHCQQMHFMLEEAVHRYGGTLAFALCPTPLSTRCNSYIPRDVDQFKDSCELAKVAMAVWVAKREAFPAFDRWMFSFESGDRWRPRSLEAARAKAVELVGQAKFDAAQADPWIDRYLQTSVQLYGATGANAIPKLVFGSRWVVPEPRDADDLISILHDSLAVPSP